MLKSLVSAISALAKNSYSNLSVAWNLGMSTYLSISKIDLKWFKKLKWKQYVIYYVVILHDIPWLGFFFVDNLILGEGGFEPWMYPSETPEGVRWTTRALNGLAC